VERHECDYHLVDVAASGADRDGVQDPPVRRTGPAHQAVREWDVVESCEGFGDAVLAFRADPPGPVRAGSLVASRLVRGGHHLPPGGVAGQVTTIGSSDSTRALR
jgi:hypothetical protein